MPRRHRYETIGAAPQSGFLGFLDLNVSVFGIFVVIFAIRVMFVPLSAGERADVLVSFAAESDDFSLILHAADGDQIVTAHGADRFIGLLADTLGARAAKAAEPLRLEVLLTPDAYGTELRLQLAIRRLNEAQGEEYAPIITRLRPVADEEQTAAAIADWRDQTSNSLGASDGS